MERQDFFELMTSASASAPGEMVCGHVPTGRAKTRVLEAHPPERSPNGVDALVDDLAGRFGFRAWRDGDELWRLDGGEVVGFLDTLNPRFWLLHTTSPTQSLNKLTRGLVGRDTRLDSAWLPRELLRQLDGEHRWVGSYFDRSTVAGSAEGARRARVRFEGDAPEGLLDLLRSQPEYAGAATLTGLGSRVTELGETAMVVADFAGGFRMSGDFSVAQSAVWNLVAAYEEWVVQLEQRHRRQTHTLDEGGHRLDGDVAVLRLGRPVEDVGAFAVSLMTAKEPFRLWGVPKQSDEEQWDVDAVDLHVGQPLRLEVLSDEVRVLLGEVTCGNTLARLLTNLQQHLDARTDLHALALA